MKKYRVSFEDTFCRDVEIVAESQEDAIENAKASDWNEQDWCDGHELTVVDCNEIDDED